MWGKADGYNPTNNLNPIDYSDILDTDGETIGIFAANAKCYFGDWKLQAILSPIFQPSVLPTEKSRWVSDYQDKFLINGVSFPINYYWKTVGNAKNLNDNLQFAFNLSRSFNNADFSVNYYNGKNDIPLVSSEMRLFKADTIDMEIMQNYYKHQVIGADISYSIGKYVFKGECALFLPRKVSPNNPYFLYALGVERTFGNIADGKNLFVLLQWFGEIKSSSISYDGTDFNHLFQRNFTTRMEIEVTKDIKASLQAVYALKYQDFYIHPEVSCNLSDGLNLILSADLLDGNSNKGGFFSSYSENKRIQMKIKYNF